MMGTPLFDIFPTIRKSEYLRLSEEQQQIYEHKVFEWLRRYGFPYYSTDKKWRQKEFSTLSKYRLSWIFQPPDIVRQTMHGLALSWSYFPEAFAVKCNDLLSPYEVFQGDTLLRKVIHKRCRMGDNVSIAGIRKMLRIFTGAQAVSNFRPTAAGYIYNTYAQDKVVWDMSSGYGGRLLGFLISYAKKYIGTDPNTSTIKGLRAMVNDFNIYNKEVELIQSGSEDYQPTEGSVDLCFTSPPYVNTEKYSNEPTQSYIKYDTYDKWINGFLSQTISNCYGALKKDGSLIVNIANTKSYPNLEKDFMDVCIDRGFELTTILKYQMSSLKYKNTGNDNFKYEPMFVFHKKDSTKHINT